MIQKAYTETSIGQCHYRFREGEGTPIVFLHQTPSSSLMYEEIIKLMPQNTCIAIDTPGFGMSDDISGNPNVADYGKSIVQALNNINILAVSTPYLLMTTVGSTPLCLDLDIFS